MGRISLKKSHFFSYFFCFLSATLIISGVITTPVMALTDLQKTIFKENNIMFWNPDEKEYDCIEPENPGEETGEDEDEDEEIEPTAGWDGHCSNVDSYGSQISKYYNDIKAVADNNGLPWEGIVAQLIGESSFMKNEVCPFNPLGLKGSGPSCDGKHRSFSSYKEAFNHYVNSIRPVREAKGKFKNDPYGYIQFLINGVPGYKYATDPNYINKVSGYACGVQKWAKANGKSTSSSSGSTYIVGDGSDPASRSTIIDVPYCESENIDSPGDSGGVDEGGDSCEELGTCCDENDACDTSNYIFPLAGATKSNYMHGSALSPLPCRNLSRGGCHHDYYAMDLGIKRGTKTEKDYPDLIGKYPDYYWQSVGVKVLAISSGKIISYKPYSRATEGYQNRCASVTYRTDDGRTFWLGHMLYNPKYKAGDTFRTGDVIGEVGPPPCAIGTQAHLHIDETQTYGSGGSVETVNLINELYSRLP